MEEPKQEQLFDNPAKWTEHWAGMPSYEHKDLRPLQTILVHLRNESDRELFQNLIGQKITSKTKYIWCPQVTIESNAGRSFLSIDDNEPLYPVFIISKGRWESRLTSKVLDKMCVPYHIVVEPQEYDFYAAVIDPAKILTLPFSNLGQGSIPARNWVWNFAVDCGAKRHWILDDNIKQFSRFEDNRKTKAGDGTIFRLIENFVNRYENIGMAGMNYEMFIERKRGIAHPPYVTNTRVYSCILIKNDIPYRWRGRYNEDTDLSIRALKDGWCTILFNAFLCDKSATMKMKGGNTDELYQGDGRLKMAQSLVDQHPDIVKITEKWGRYQHQVDYSGFKTNALRLKPGVVIPSGVDNYGMELHITVPQT